MPDRERLPIHRLAVALLALCGALAACVKELPISLPSAALGRADDVPVAVVTGQASALYFFQAPVLGDAMTAVAVRDARSKMDNDGLSNALVESRQICFPACAWPLVSYQKTVVTGTLMRYHKLKDDEPPAQAPRPSLTPGQRPPVALQAERLEDLFAQDPSQAKEFLESLGPEPRGALRDYILTQDGVLSSYDNAYKAPNSAPDARKAFLRWFVPAFTSYRLVFE